MEALKAIKIIGNQNDGRAVFLFLPKKLLSNNESTKAPVIAMHKEKYF